MRWAKIRIAGQKLKEITAIKPVKKLIPPGNIKVIRSWVHDNSNLFSGDKEIGVNGIAQSQCMRFNSALRREPEICPLIGYFRGLYAA